MFLPVTYLEFQHFWKYHKMPICLRVGGSIYIDKNDSHNFQTASPNGMKFGMVVVLAGGRFVAWVQSRRLPHGIVRKQIDLNME